MEDWTETIGDGPLIINKGHWGSIEILINQLLSRCFLEYGRTQNADLLDIIRLIVEDALGDDCGKWCFLKYELLLQAADIRLPINRLCEYPFAIQCLRKALNMLVGKKPEQPNNSNIPDLDKDQTEPVRTVKLTDFFLKYCEHDEHFQSKTKEIHRRVKNGKIKGFPKPTNKPKDNQTKLYKPSELKVFWPVLKQNYMPNLPNLK